MQATGKYQISEADAQRDQKFLCGRVALLKQARQESAALLGEGCRRYQTRIDCTQFAAWAFADGRALNAETGSEAGDADVFDDTLEANELDDAELLDA